MNNELYHYGVGHKDGGHSGRYPWGSGDNPKQSAGGKTTKTNKRTEIHRAIAKTALKVSNKLGPFSSYNIYKKFNKIGGRADSPKKLQSAIDAVQRDIDSLKQLKDGGGSLTKEQVADAVAGLEAHKRKLEEKQREYYTKQDTAKQYKKDYKTTSKTVNKLSKKGGLSKDFTNRDAVYKKMNDEVFNKQAVKDYLEFDKQVADYIKKTAREKGIREDQVLITQKDPIGAELSKRMNEAKKAGEEVCDKYLNSYAKALLSDISYEDSAGARAAVRDMLLKTGFRNMLWG